MPTYVGSLPRFSSRSTMSSSGPFLVGQVSSANLARLAAAIAGWLNAAHLFLFRVDLVELEVAAASACPCLFTAGKALHRT